MINIYNQTFVVVRLMRYEIRDKTKIIFRRQKKKKKYPCAENRIKYTNAPVYFECTSLH